MEDEKRGSAMALPPAPAVVDVDDEGEEETEVVRWEKFLPRMPVRVMVVEGDDSTRQIIAALLRKCSYKVATISDGLKAWELLKEKPKDVDLILTEVELPSLSGFNLLTMIMDDEACSSIPVIMMSSHDSMSMVFKCMLKGAADFLVKPIRKNELRNLWQHVWRRQLANGAHGSVHGSQDVAQIKHKIKDISGNVIPTVHDPLLHEDKECSEQGSDAQSSCTRSGMEVCSEHKKMLELKQPKLQNDALKDHTVQNAGKHVQTDCVIMSPESKEEEGMHRGAEADKDYSLKNHEESTPSKIAGSHLINCQSQSQQASAEKCTFQSEILNTPEVVHENDVKNNLNCRPQLELSLRRSQESNNDKHQNAECNNALNHSYSSAFSAYTNRTLLPTLSSKTRSGNQNCEHLPNSLNTLQNLGATAAPQYSSIIPRSFENTKNIDAGNSVQDGSAVKCTPVRVIPFPVPVSGVPFDNLGSKYATFMQPILYQQAAHPFWASVPLIWQEQEARASSSYQSGVKDSQIDDHKNRNPKFHDTDKKDKPTHPSEEGLPVLTGTGVSASSSICSVGMNRDNIAMNQNMSNLLKVSVDEHNGSTFNSEGTKKVDLCCLSPREAALNKFRLKRKERCFEKKVRYQSRKLLAEQRPRVKGQFVRKV